MNIIEKQLTDLIPYENNPRNNDEAVQYVANSIQDFGFKVPIVIDKEGVIVAGHTRYKAAQQLGLDKVPCIVADDLTPEQVKAFRLADNKTAEIATWDFELLDLEVSELGAYDMTLYGFEEAESEGDEIEAKERTDLSDKVVETYEIIIECADEEEQEATYNKLVEDGYKCRVLTL